MLTPPNHATVAIAPKLKLLNHFVFIVLTLNKNFLVCNQRRDHGCKNLFRTRAHLSSNKSRAKAEWNAIAAKIRAFRDDILGQVGDLECNLLGVHSAIAYWFVFI